MAEDKKIEGTEVGSEGFAKDLAETFVDCYKTVFDMELKVDEIEKIASEIIPEEFCVCDIPVYLQKMGNLVQEVMSIPVEMVSALNAAISGVTAEIKKDLEEKAEELKEKTEEKVEEVKDDIEEKAEEVKEQTNEIIDDAKEKVDEIKEDISSETTKIAETLKVPAEAVKYPAMGIILKRFQIIKYRCEIIQKSIMLMMAKVRKRLLKEMLLGKDDAGSAISAPIKALLMGIAITANVLATIVGVILNVINSIVILNVDAAGCAFGPTPKSFMTTSKMKVANSKQSTTAPIPEPVDKLITEAERGYEKAKGEVKKAQVLAMASAGASSIADGGEFNPGIFPSLPKLDGTAIRQAISLLLATIFEAEALPRYEKLSPTNIRFLTFLITGFEPAAQKTFGIPGFP